MAGAITTDTYSIPDAIRALGKLCALYTIPLDALATGAGLHAKELAGMLQKPEDKIEGINRRSVLEKSVTYIRTHYPQLQMGSTVSSMMIIAGNQPTPSEEQNAALNAAIARATKPTTLSRLLPAPDTKLPAAEPTPAPMEEERLINLKQRTPLRLAIDTLATAAGMDKKALAARCVITENSKSNQWLNRLMGISPIANDQLTVIANALGIPNEGPDTVRTTLLEASTNPQTLETLKNQRPHAEKKTAARPPKQTRTGPFVYLTPKSELGLAVRELCAVNHYRLTMFGHILTTQTPGTSYSAWSGRLNGGTQTSQEDLTLIAKQLGVSLQPDESPADAILRHARDKEFLSATLAASKDRLSYMPSWDEIKQKNPEGFCTMLSDALKKLLNANGLDQQKLSAKLQEPDPMKGPRYWGPRLTLGVNASTQDWHAIAKALHVPVSETQNPLHAIMDAPNNAELMLQLTLARDAQRPRYVTRAYHRKPASGEISR